MMHITGGAYTKLKDIMAESDITNTMIDIIIGNEHEVKPQKIFYELYKKKVSDKDMYKTFNCGVGFVLSSGEKEARNIVGEIKSGGFEADVIGKVVAGSGKVKIDSMFSNKIIEL